MPVERIGPREVLRANHLPRHNVLSTLGAIILNQQCQPRLADLFQAGEIMTYCPERPQRYIPEYEPAPCLRQSKGGIYYLQLNDPELFAAQTGRVLNINTGKLKQGGLGQKVKQFLFDHDNSLMVVHIINGHVSLGINNGQEGKGVNLSLKIETILEIV